MMGRREARRNCSTWSRPTSPPAASTSPTCRTSSTTRCPTTPKSTCTAWAAPAASARPARAISLVSGMDEMTFTQLRREFGIKWEKKELPERSEILKLQAERLAAEILQEAREVELTSFTFVAEHLRNVEGSTEAIAFLLKRYFGQVEEAREAEAREEDERLRKLQDKRIKRGGDDGDEADEGRDRKRGRDRGDRDRGDRDRGDRDRGERSRREPPARSEEPDAAGAPSGAPDSDAVRLFVNRGKSHGFSEKQVRELVIDIAGTGESTDIPNVQLRRTHAFVEANEAIAAAAIAASERGVERDDKPVTVERARTR